MVPAGFMDAEVSRVLTADFPRVSRTETSPSRPDAPATCRHGGLKPSPGFSGHVLLTERLESEQRAELLSRAI